MDFRRSAPVGFVTEHITVYAVMCATPEVHTFQVLTKRPQRMAALLNNLYFQTEVEQEVHKLGTHMFAGFTRPNHWWGASIENDTYHWRADHVRATPAAVRWLSLEPLIGPLPRLDLTDIDWVVVGAESGRGARPMDEGWVRDIRDYCISAGVAFFYKQNATPGGRKIPTPELDGRTWTEYPT